MALLYNLHWKDGSEFNPPKNPLWNRWREEYPSIPHPWESQVCDGYSCMWCDRCPSGTDWKIPEEDKEEYEKYRKEYDVYIDSHGGYENLYFDVDQEILKMEVN